MSASTEKIPAVDMYKNSTRDGGEIGINLEGKEQGMMRQPLKSGLPLKSILHQK